MTTDHFGASRRIAKIAMEHLERFVSGETDDFYRAHHLIKATKRAYSVEEGVSIGLY